VAANRTKQTGPEVLELDYQLAELPSSQHRAGLAGLVLMADWLNRQPNKRGICTIERDVHSATLKIDEQGLEDLFNEVYAATDGEQERKQLRKNNRTGEVIPPLREEKRKTLDAKGRPKEQAVYIYKATIPKGAFLLEDYPSADVHDGAWIKLWRDVIWNIFRGKPTTRKPFEDRAKGKRTNDAAKAWQELRQPLDYTVDLPSTYYIGAQANNAENVPFKDRARFQFLLHFWPYVAQIYVPAIIDNEGERKLIGYALAIPDVANLDLFCEELPLVLRQRGTEMSGYRPRDCIVDLAVEGALDTLRRLRDRLTQIEGEQRFVDLLLGVDVVHAERQGNNIRLLGSTRVDPEAQMIDKYVRVRENLWNPTFRRQRLLNLVHRREWHDGFDTILCGLPYERTVGDNAFRHDARESFPEEVKAMSEEPASTERSEAPEINEESLIYRVVGIYLSQKLKSKYQLDWASVKNDADKRNDYEEKKGKLAREAFLAIRSRTGQDFIDYFASTLCSVPQNMNEQRFAALTKALLEDTDKIRTLTMLALSARG